jgi:Mg-chelatase subunit ChlI
MRELLEIKQLVISNRRDIRDLSARLGSVQAEMTTEIATLRADLAISNSRQNIEIVDTKKKQTAWRHSSRHFPAV